MPAFYRDDYPIPGWDAAVFVGPLTGGSSGFQNSTGCVFQPTATGDLEGQPATWLTGWRPAGDVTVRVSISSAASAGAGWVAFVRWDDALFGQVSVDFTSGGPFDIVLPAAIVTSDIRGIQVFSGDNAVAHNFTLHSVVVETPVQAGMLSLGIDVQIDCRLALPVDIDVSFALMLGLDVSVFSASAFDAAAGYGVWAIWVAIAGQTVTPRLTGRVSISAGEDAARRATLSLVPLSADWLDSLDNARVEIDISVSNQLGAASRRVFTGTVETFDFNAAERVIDLVCLDGWQERQKACASAAEVALLLGGLAVSAPQVLPWDEATPDPVAYFEGLAATVAGATCIGPSGDWRVVPWLIGSPRATLTADDIDDASLSLRLPQRADLPGKIQAVLTHRHHRLHQVEVALHWFRLPYVDYVLYGYPALVKQTVIAALEGLSDWHIKGEPDIKAPIPGTYTVFANGGNVPYIVPVVGNDLLCEELNVTLYRRWYQEVETSYTYEIVIAGGSDRVDTVSASLASTFDAGEWEQTPTTETSIGIYSANAPGTANGAPVKTGYEGLLPPLVPPNTGVDWWGDLTQADLDQSMRHLLAKAVRQTASALRQRQVAFSKPIDLRFDIGDVLAVDCYGVQATGQIAELEFDLDLDTGAATVAYTLAVPKAAGGQADAAAVVVPPVPAVGHALLPPTLGNWYGARIDTPTVVPEAQIQGFLFNTLPTGNSYSAAAPAYHEQFRVIMPQIDSLHRDGLKQAGTVTAAWSVAAGSLNVNF